MRRDVGLSKLLAAGAIPLCIWGMVAALCLFLIDLRSVFIEGGENRLRVGVLSFAAGSVLVQRLAYLQGRSAASIFAMLFLALITVFAAQNAYTYKVPAHPIVVFVLNEVLFIILWLSGRAITRACSADDEAAIAAAETGSLRKLPRWRSREKKLSEAAAAAREAELEGKWAERLPKGHPGVVLLYFSLVSIPLFGLGLLFFDPASDEWARVRLGGYLFVYLWCALALLFLSSLGQMRAYFERREVSLPDSLGLTWLGIGFAVVTIVMIGAFLAPHPDSMPTRYIRDRIVGAYRGTEGDWGFMEWLSGKDGGKEKRQGQGGRDDPGGGRGSQGRGSKSQDGKSRESDKNKQADHATFQKVFKVVMVGILAVGAIGVVVAIIAVIAAIWKGLAEGIAGARRLREKKAKASGKRKAKPDAVALARFARFANPFAGGGAGRDGNAMVRYLWEAMLAFCADAGSPCAPDQTPHEFVEGKPDPLRGFENSARMIADLFIFSEFSGQPLPATEMPKLQKFWAELERHAARAGI